MPYPNFHAARIIDPDKFQADSFRTITIGQADAGITAIVGRLKGETTTKIQTYRFDKKKFTVAEAKKWLKDHDIKFISFEPATEGASLQSNEMEYKTFPFNIIEYEEKEDKAQNKFGIIKGYASTYGNEDRGGDIIESGAFTKSLKRYQNDGRPIKMHYQHSHTDIIGGFPIDQVREDEKGLFVKGEINLNVQKGKEAYALAKQGVLSDMSIGFSINDMDYNKNGDIRILKDLELWEISLVGEPMNPEARITSVKDIKAVISFQNYPIADKDTAWDGNAAEKRVRKFTNAEDKPNQAYRNAHMWYDADNPDNFTSYKLLYVDVIDNKLRVVPRAIFEKAALLHGGRGGLNISHEDKVKIAKLVQKYYEKMGEESPLTDEDFKSQENFSLKLDICQIEYINSKKEFETILRESGLFSKQAAIYLASFFKPKSQSESEIGELKETLLKIKELLKNL